MPNKNNNIIQGKAKNCGLDLDYQNVLVAIRCTAYNHESYIRDALEGFVMQKTNFPFVAIVHDDASTDGTAAIIREYAEKYPDIIIPIFETENQYSKKDGSLARIMNQACEKTGAKYIALCEGDDYWTDPNKLQLQVDFLESHPYYSMCFHGVEEKYETKVNKNSKITTKIESREYNIDEILKKWTVPTCSMVLREDVFPIAFDKRFIVGDNVIWASASSRGLIRGFEKVMGVYRRNSGGWTTRNLNISPYCWIQHYSALKDHYPSLTDSTISNILSPLYAWETMRRLKQGKIREMFSLSNKALQNFKFSYILNLCNIIISHIRFLAKSQNNKKA